MSATYVATAGLETAPIQDGAVLYNLKTGKFVMLNASAAAIWSAVAAPKSQSEIAAGLRIEFPDAATRDIDQDIVGALESLRALELVNKREAGTVSGAVVESARIEAMKDGKAYESPTIKVLDEEELLNLFQMTAAEISVASCWWSNCATPGCP